MLKDRVENAVLLQGPNGPFFRRFADDLIARGARVTKVNFQPGDWLFYHRGDRVTFRRPLDEWPAFFRELAEKRGFDSLFVFGDCRPIHREAIRIARGLGMAVWVFEEGYLRPDFVTLERDGVNGHSRAPKDADFYREQAKRLPAPDTPLSVGPSFRIQAWYTTLHAMAVTLFGWLFPHYRHHRNVNCWLQMALWIRGWFRKHLYAWREHGVLEYLVREHPGDYFLVPLQVHLDSQMQHSDYEDHRDFIEEVVSTFSRCAPTNTILVLKHHPHDRPYRDYRRFLAELERRHGCVGRLIYIHDQHLPTLLRSARGVVTMNSTVGTTALEHRTPVKALGRAVYNFAGLTSAKTLAEFFRDPGEVDDEVFQGFVKYLRTTSQHNGSFYRRLDAAPSVANRLLSDPTESALEVGEAVESP